MTTANPSKVCDIVLKGGITSGVVYPLALESLSQAYRFANIGGTSAGAIAAAAAAAAEYGRPVADAGFARLSRIPGEIGPGLLSMFQPSPPLRPLFEILVAALKAKGGGRARLVPAVVGAAVSGYFASVAVGVLVGVGVVGVALVAGSWGFVAFGLLAALLGGVVGLALRIAKAVTKELPANGFGLCPGIRQPCGIGEGFTDYLARLVDEASGRPKDAPPLTFGDLKAPPGGRPPINLLMMTTSLMEKRPYTLPMSDPEEGRDHRFVFEAGEWSELFPEKVMTHLKRVSTPFVPKGGEAGAFYHLPRAADLPIVVAARMSLSFPLLISAVPLYARDFTLREDSERQKLRRCVFSDGGLSSNFPIHFFDRLLPGTPTFAIALDAFDARRNNPERKPWLPGKAQSGIAEPLLPFAGITGFLMRLLDAAKDWQDSLQSTLPGYRERIVHIALKPDEGGLNLAMGPKTIETLVGYGKQAGEMLRDDFDLDAHRWRRFLVAGDRIEETLGEVADAYELPGGADYPTFLARYAADPKQYKQEPPVADAMVARMAELARLGKAWRAPKGFRDGHIPRPKTTLRISPKP